MTQRPNTETRLISALVNTREIGAAAGYGVSPEMFFSYRGEYEWLLDYPKSFGMVPSLESLHVKFPEMPISSDYEDVQFICSDLKAKYHKKSMVRAVERAGSHIREDDLASAYEELKAVKQPDITASTMLTNALLDESVIHVIERTTSDIVVPWKSLQVNTGGPAPGQYWVFAARYKQGKSWVLAVMMADALLQGHDVTMLSLEMPKAQVLPRIHSILAAKLGYKITHNEMRGTGLDPIEYRRLIRALKTECGGELRIKDTSDGPISTLHVQALTRETKLAVIDHEGLLTTPTGKRAIQDWREMAFISNVIKEIAISNDVPIATAAQINREGISNSWRPPASSHLAQSDAIGQDADVIVTMKRRSTRVMVYSLEDNRHGESGILWHSKFEPSTGAFTEINGDAAQKIIDEDKKDAEE